jgi:DNA modification methylase
MKLIPYRDILLVKKSNSLIDNIVRMFLKQEYTHSEYVIDQWHTISTNFDSPVSVRHFGYNMCSVDIYRLKNDLTSEQVDIITEQLQKLTKVKYDLLEAFCIGLGIKHKDNDKYICITLITQALEAAGILPEGLHNQYKGFDVFTKSGYFEKVNS